MGGSVRTVVRDRRLTPDLHFGGQRLDDPIVFESAFIDPLEYHDRPLVKSDAQQTLFVVWFSMESARESGGDPLSPGTLVGLDDAKCYEAHWFDPYAPRASAYDAIAAPPQHEASWPIPQLPSFDPSRAEVAGQRLLLRVRAVSCP